MPTDADRPPPGRQRSARQVIAIAQAVPKIREERRRHRTTYARAYLKAGKQWQVSVFARTPGASDSEVGQVLIDDSTGGVIEAWTGFQVAWTMARGYEGAFGRKINSLYVWLPLLGLFLLPFLRPPWRLLHLDLAMLCLFSVSLAFFNAGRIGVSVPLAYPPLVYLLVRMLALARARGHAGGDAARPALVLLVGPGFLGMAVVFLLGFRLGLNVAASNVIDVGYAGVIGADRVTGGEPIYGHFPADNRHGDTYGPVNYYAYVPFELALPWGGRWDGLPAAHAAAIAFDSACALLAWLLGRRLRGPRLGLLLAYLWLAFPFTLLVSNSNANDSLVATLVLAALLAAGRPVARGALTAAAALTKFAPLALAPLLACYRAGDAAPPQHSEGPDDEQATPGAASRRAVAGTAVGLAGAALVLLAPIAIADGGLGNLWERTIAFQADRESPFSLWGYHDLDLLQRLVQVVAAALALAVAFVPRRRDAISVVALAAAVLIAVQLGVTHWFYLYIVWFAPLVLAAVLAEHEEPKPKPG